MSSDDRSNVRERLGRLFEVPFAEHGSRWDSLWQSGDLPFDRGCPNPAFVDALADKSDLFGELFVRKPDGTTRRKRALVPGCGRGYDVLLLASFGYDAYGLEISPGAKQACETFAAEKGGEYSKSTTKHGFGSWKFLLGDFLKDSWQKEAGLENHAFDLIYDYTFLSALPPSARPAWSARFSELLSKSSESRIVCVEFPTYKDPTSGGPPFGLPPEIYLAHLSRPGDELPYSSGLPEKSSYAERNASGLTRMDHWQPKRTHDIGAGTDWVSVWKPA